MTSNKNQKLEIVSQESVARENFILNGQNKDLHLVVKNIPFTIQVNGSNVDFRKSQLSAKLYYDFADSTAPREVETLKASPLEFICHVEPSGNSVAFELKIGVLSSSHEGAFFRVKLSAVDPETKANLEVYSAPLKIMSKKSQVMRRAEKRSLVKMEPGATNLPAEMPAKRKKLVAEDTFGPEPALPVISAVEAIQSPSSNSISQLTEIMLRMEQAQKQQSQMLARLISEQQQSHQMSNNSSPISSSPSSSSPECFSTVSTGNSETQEFEKCFQALLSAYQRIPAFDRKKRLSRTFSQMKEESSQAFSDIIDSYAAEGHHKPLCGEQTCIHKEQLDSLELFCSEIMRDPFYDAPLPNILSSQPTSQPNSSLAQNSVL